MSHSRSIYGFVLDSESPDPMIAAARGLIRSVGGKLRVSPGFMEWRVKLTGLSYGV